MVKEYAVRSQTVFASPGEGVQQPQQETKVGQTMFILDTIQGYHIEFGDPIFHLV